MFSDRLPTIGILATTKLTKMQRQREMQKKTKEGIIEVDPRPQVRPIPPSKTPPIIYHRCHCCHHL